MKCPHCNYQHRWDWVQDEFEMVEGDKGNFYEMPVSARRQIPYEDDSSCKVVYACPSCGKLFIDL